MKIVFIMNSIELCGGNKVVFEYANRLKERGHEVDIIYSLVPVVGGSKYSFKRLFLKVAGTLLRLVRGNDVYWFPLKVNVIDVLSTSPKYEGLVLPKCDVVIATCWRTAYSVKEYQTKADKFYLVQHYEEWDGEKEKVDGAYGLGLKNIVISEWIKKKLNKIGVTVHAVIPDGIDTKEFYPLKERRVLLPYRYEDWKGFKDGLNAIKQVRLFRRNVKFVVFGPKPKENIPSWIEFHELPSREDLRKLYSSCDIFMFPSRVEGFGLPPLEAMACGVAVVSTEVGVFSGGSFVSEVDVLLSKPRAWNGLAQNVVRLLDDEKLRVKIARNGRKRVLTDFSWNRSVDLFENSISFPYGKEFK